MKSIHSPPAPTFKCVPNIQMCTPTPSHPRESTQANRHTHMHTHTYARTHACTHLLGRVAGQAAHVHARALRGLPVRHGILQPAVRQRRCARHLHKAASDAAPNPHHATCIKACVLQPAGQQQQRARHQHVAASATNVAKKARGNSMWRQSV